jgi:hypothetical protein
MTQLLWRRRDHGKRINIDIVDSTFVPQETPFPQTGQANPTNDPGGHTLCRKFRDAFSHLSATKEFLKGKKVFSGVPTERE